MLSVAVVAAMFILAGCGGRSGATNAPPTAGGAPTPVGITCTGSGGLAVSITTDRAFFLFLDSINSGESATWTNNDDEDHTVTFYQGPDCGTVSSGETVSATLSGAPGEYRYHCTIHASMTGVIRIL